ncbi:PEPxxWA-CTERM sorting domain-containing protein [Aquabacterium sp.]|uniref:PEPxxWA-CTERM sorting domain-containing protein n=1 Tax=Aquabacterium sp. TaxID=1872578 RepID=UPI003CFD3930
MKLATLMSAVTLAVLGLGTAHATNLTGSLSFDGQGQHYFEYGPIPSVSFSVSDPDFINLTIDAYASTADGWIRATSIATLPGQLTAVIETQQTVLNNSSSAAFIADIQVNGASVWQSRYELSFNGDLYPVLTQSGQALGANELLNYGVPYPSGHNPHPTSTGARISLNNYAGLVNLGTFAPGEVFDVRYTLTAQSTFVDPAGCGECGRATAYIFDPFALSPSGLSITAVTAVPEPATWALPLFGLGAIGVAARRRQAQAA